MWMFSNVLAESLEWSLQRTPETAETAQQEQALVILQNRHTLWHSQTEADTRTFCIENVSIRENQMSIRCPKHPQQYSS